MGRKKSFYYSCTAIYFKPFHLIVRGNVLSACIFKSAFSLKLMRTKSDDYGECRRISNFNWYSSVICDTLLYLYGPLFLSLSWEDFSKPPKNLFNNHYWWYIPSSCVDWYISHIQNYWGCNLFSRLKYSLTHWYMPKWM